MDCRILARDRIIGFLSGEPSGTRTIKGPLVGNIVDQQDAHGATVVGGSNGAEALLAGGIPDLQLYALAIELNGPDLEVDSDRGDERGRKGVLTEPKKTA